VRTVSLRQLSFLFHLVVEGPKGCLPCPNFHLLQMAISIHNSTTQRVRSEPKMSENVQFCTFSPNIFDPTPKITPKPHFGGPFNAKSLIQRALRKLHVNGATKLKLYSYIGLYLGVCQNFSARGRLEGAGLLNVNLGPPIISETTGARKLNLKTQVDVVKYSLWVQIFFH